MVLISPAKVNVLSHLSYLSLAKAVRSSLEPTQCSSYPVVEAIVEAAAEESIKALVEAVVEAVEEAITMATAEQALYAEVDVILYRRPWLSK